MNPHKALLLAGFLSALALAQNAFEAQAERGRVLSLKLCAGCHGASLEGRYGPPLRGPRFLAHWGGQDARALRNYVAQRMPLGRAGSLGEEQTLELLAYILRANGYTASGEALRLEQLPEIQITRP